MFVSLVSIGLIVAGVYLALGFLVGLWLVLGAINRLDAASKGSSIGFRLLILPGMALFWPLFLLRINKNIAVAPDECNAHRHKAAGGAA